MELYVDQETKESSGELPRKISASKLFRWIIKAVTTDMKTWKKLLRTDKDIKEVQEFIRPRLMMMLGITEEQRKKIMSILGDEDAKENDK
jgi:hypothetical protein